ncbi:hypothetical protein NC652_037965 [Populus alba x Populus x berolinensis]|nr:hypothetical protein NC652_037965 [Populus alba x Populus x berolinensis]
MGVVAEWVSACEGEREIVAEGLWFVLVWEINERRLGKRWLLEAWGLALGLFGWR